MQDDEDNGNLTDSDSDVPDELKQDYIDEVTGEDRPSRSKIIKPKNAEFFKYWSIEF